MRNKITIHLLLGVTVLLAVMMAGCAGTDTRESTGEYVDDSTITATVKAAIYNDPKLVVGQISVETFKGVVQLSGFVNSAQAAYTAEEIARSVKGVRSVRNSLIVK
ncbi:MAG: BON domain-containing protein [Desulfarculus sp.]|nr:BON domain-containing protein [Desulfarculus sp.]